MELVAWRWSDGEEKYLTPCALDDGRAVEFRIKYANGSQEELRFADREVASSVCRALEHARELGREDMRQEFKTLLQGD